MQLGKSGRQQYWHWVPLLRDAYRVFFGICHGYNPLLLEICFLISEPFVLYSFVF
jgi:hypothetical protein